MRYLHASIRSIFVFLTFLVFTNLIAGQTAGPDPLKIPWWRFQTSNGLRVVLLPDASASDVAVEFWVGVGARNEEAGKFGFAHFFEHATPYGLMKDDVARAKFRSFLTDSNAQTRKDYLRYFVQVKPEGVDLALRYVAERLSADESSITTAVIESHRKNVLNEMNRQEMNPLYSPTATMARDAASFGPSHPYGHGTYGSVKENESFTAEDVKAWYRKYFSPQNIILFVAGNFNPEATVPMIDSLFANIKKGEPIENFDPGTVRSSGANAVVKANAPKHHLSLVWPIGGKKDAASDVAELLSKIVDKRLEKTKNAQIISDAGSSSLFERFQFAGRFGLFANFNSLQDRRTIQGWLRSPISDIARHGVTDAELAAGKEALLRDFEEKRARLGFIDSRIEMVGEGLLFQNDPDLYLKRLRRQQVMTSADLRLAARSLERIHPGVVLILSRQNRDDRKLCI